MEEISLKQWLYHIMFTIIIPIIWLICLVVFILPLGIVAPIFDIKLKKEKRYLYFLPALVFRIRQYTNKK